MLYLSHHAHICTLEDSVLFLDLKRNQYATIPRSALPALQVSLAGFRSMLPSIHHQVKSCTTATADLKDLVAHGLLTQSATHGRPVAPLTLEPPCAALAPGLRNPQGGANMRAISAFVLSYLYVGANMRARRLHALVVNLQVAAARTSPDAASTSTEHLLTLLSAFRRYRTFVYTAHDECLFNALVLTHFLHHYSVPATLVIGVRAKPFYAHAWVQVANVVVDDRLEYVLRFKPILAV